jgi:Polyketide cyclase / dehydrase and lipid transport
MGVDVVTSVEIARSRDEVARFAADVENATAWYENIKSVQWRTEPPLKVGSRVAFVAEFLGRRLEYVYEIRGWVPGERLVMSTEQGPFAMQTTYTWEDAGPGRTLMVLRNSGEPRGFKRIGAPLMARAMRRANEQDLARLKRLLER